MVCDVTISAQHAHSLKVSKAKLKQRKHLIFPEASTKQSVSSNPVGTVKGADQVVVTHHSSDGVAQEVHSMGITLLHGNFVQVAHLLELHLQQNMCV